MPHLRNAAFAAAFLALAGGPASSQTTPVSPPPKTNLDSRPGTLSDKLSDTHGVIKPSGNLDPGMRKPAPRTGTMPVIKPKDVTPGVAK